MLVKERLRLRYLLLAISYFFFRNEIFTSSVKNLLKNSIGVGKDGLVTPGVDVNG